MANPLYGAIGELGRTFRDIGQSGLDYEIKKAEQDWRIGQAEWKKGQTERAYADQALQRQAQNVLNQKVIDQAERDRQPFYVLENIKKGLDDPRRPMGTTEKVAGGELMSKILPDVVRSVFGGRLKKGVDGRAVVSKTLPDGTEEIVTEGEFRRPEIQKALGYAISSQYSGLRSLRIKAASGDKEAEKQLAGINSTRENKIAFLEKELAHKRKMRDEAGAMGMSAELFDKGIAATERDIDKAIGEDFWEVATYNGIMYQVNRKTGERKKIDGKKWEVKTSHGQTVLFSPDTGEYTAIGAVESATDELDMKLAKKEYNEKQAELRALNRGVITDETQEYITEHSVEGWTPQSGFKTQDEFLITRRKNQLNSQVRNLATEINKTKKAAISTPGTQIKRPTVPEVPEVKEKPRKKGPGYLGTLQRPDGRVSTEISIGVNFDGKERQIPTIVPTSTKEELKYLLGGGKPTRPIINKAVAHARTRISQGKSPFAQKGEQIKKVGSREAAERIMALYAKDSPEAESLAIEFKEKYFGPEHKEARDWFEKERKPYIEAFIGGKITEKSPEYYTLKDAPEIVVNVLKRIKTDNSEERLKRVQEDFSESVESGFGDFKDFKRIWEGLGMIGRFTKEEFGYFLEQLGSIPLPIKK